MDSETAMKRVVGEVSFALSKYAEKAGWKKDDYWIYYYINIDWGVVNFVFVSRHFDQRDEQTSHADVWHFLIDYFKNDPAILRDFTLVVRSKARVDQGGLSSIGPKYREFDPKFQEFWSFAPVSHPS
jgi:hypothetical protein